MRMRMDREELSAGNSSNHGWGLALEKYKKCVNEKQPKFSLQFFHRYMKCPLKISVSVGATCQSVKIRQVGAVELENHQGHLWVLIGRTLSIL